jgi:hypothetical protein
MRKTVSFGNPFRNVQDVDSWVGNEPEPRLEPVPPAKPVERPVDMKRFTIDVPADLHRRIKAQCATEGVKMADVLREMLETRFPVKS